MRKSDADTFLLPKKEREIAYAQMLLQHLRFSAVVSPINENWPDVLAQCHQDHRQIGIELTQSNLCDQPMDNHRIFERIISAAFRKFERRSEWDSSITIEFVANISAKSFGKNFDPAVFVEEIVALAKNCMGLLESEAEHFEILFENKAALALRRVATVYAVGRWRYCLFDAEIQLPIASFIREIYVISHSGALAAPYVSIENTSKSRDQSIHAQNWSQLEDAIRSKVTAFESRAMSARSFDEVWLIVHYPVYGVPSFGAGRLDGRLIDRTITAACRFDRVFLLGFGEAFELDIENSRFDRIAS